MTDRHLPKEISLALTYVVGTLVGPSTLDFGQRPNTSELTVGQARGYFYQGTVDEGIIAVVAPRRSGLTQGFTPVGYNILNTRNSRRY